MTNGEVSQPITPLPIWSTVRKAFLLAWNSRHHFGCLLVIPAILSTLLNISASYWMEFDESTELSTGLMQFVIFLVPHLAIFSFLAISIHRSILLGEPSVASFGLYSWTLRETRFLLWLLGIYVVGWLMLIVLGTPVSLFVLAIGAGLAASFEIANTILDHPAFIYTVLALLLVPFAYFVGRLSLVLPAIAVDLRLSTNPSWSQTKGNGWRVAFLLGGIPLFSLGAQYFLEMVLDDLAGIERGEGSQWFGAYSVITSGLDALLYCLLAVIEVSILSLVFKELSRWQPSEAQATSES